MDALDSAIKNHAALAAQYKREGNTPMNRYHHGFAEGMKYAQSILEKEYGNDTE